MFHSKSLHSPKLFSIGLLLLIILALSFAASAQTQRSPSDVVREFYKAMHERRFKDAWSLTVYRPAVENLTAEEMEDLRPVFEAQAAEVPAQIQIDTENISGNTAQVFVQIPATDSTPQITSKPADLILVNGAWIVGTEAEQANVKKAGSRYFLDALIDLNQGSIEDLLKRLIAVQALYAQTHNGTFGELKDLLNASLISADMIDPKSSGYNFHIVVPAGGKTFIANAEPTRYGHTGKLSYWMDQTGAIKNADNGGKPLKTP
jgi:hypothetical protein